jgi:hypothetical protein
MYLQKELSRSRIENEDGTINGLSGEISFKSLMDRNTVDIGIIHKPDDLVAKDLTIVLR